MKKIKSLYAVYEGPTGSEADKYIFLQLEKNGILQKGKIYLVQEVNMHSSMTDIVLEGIPEKSLNSVAFSSYYKKGNKLQKHDIYSDKAYNPYLSNDSSI